VGARAPNSFDSRHLDGIVDYIRVVDSAMSPSEIRARFRKSIQAQEADTLCYGSIIPEYPNAGQAVTMDTRFRFRITANGACTQPGFEPTLRPGDSVQVEIAKDVDFDSVLVRLVVANLSFKLEAKDILALAKYRGDAYWRARILHGKPEDALKKRAAAPATDWSMPRPFLLDLSAPATGLSPRIRDRSRILAMPGSSLSVPGNGNRVPGLWSVDGARSPIGWTRQGGRWNARIPQGGDARVLILGWE
jgi:hypothetical protein